MIVATQSTFRGSLYLDEPMSKHTSWRLGGPADRYYVPADLADLQGYLAALEPEIELLWVGLGSNLLVRDGGYRGQIIAPQGALKSIEVRGDGCIYAECGVSCAKLAKVCAREQLEGGDFFAGIPGTIGGALAMNAGAFGGETWSVVRGVVTIDRSGALTQREASEFEVGYRHVELPPQQWFVGADFEFNPRPDGARSNIRQLLQKRNESQPIGLPSCGSVFKNPPGGHAAQLIDAAGLKGYCIGEACVSEKHANFIISNARTRAAEVEALIGHIRETVENRFGVRLETEVRIVGEAS